MKDNSIGGGSLGEPSQARYQPSAGGKTLPQRRTIVKGAAWSVPVIAVALAAPAAAASTTPIEDACALAGSFSQPTVKATLLSGTPTSSGSDYDMFTNGTPIRVGVVATFIYPGPAPALASSLAFHPAASGIAPWDDIDQAIDWRLASPATVTSSSGNWTTGAFSPSPDKALYTDGVGVLRAGGASDYVQPGEIFTLNFKMTATSAPRLTGPSGNTTGGMWHSAGVFSCGSQVSPPLSLYDQPNLRSFYYVLP